MKRTIGIITGVLAVAGATAFAQQNQPQTQQQEPQGNSSQGKGATADQSGTATGSESSRENVGTKEKPIMVVAATVNAKGTITDKSRLTRTLTVKLDDGSTVKMKVGREVKNFNDIKEGDRVNLTYNQETAIALRKGPGAAGATVGHALITPTEGAPPVAAEISTIESTAVIEDIDQNARALKLRAPDGSTRTINVGTEVQNLGEFQKGDQVAVRTTEAVAIEVQKTNK